MGITGQLNLMVGVNQGNISDCSIALNRPNLAKKLLIGQSPQSAISIIKSLFAVCKYAQTSSAKLVLNQIDSTSSDTQQLNWGITLENIEQLFWRLFIDFPPLLQQQLPIAPFAKLKQSISSTLTLEDFSAKRRSEIKSLCIDAWTELTGINCRSFCDFTPEQLTNWQKQSPSPLNKMLTVIPVTAPNNTAMLPEAPSFNDLSYLSACMQQDDDFCQHPHFNQLRAETGPLSYLQSHPLFKQLIELGIRGRLLARAIFLAQTIESLTCNKPTDLCGIYNTDQHQLIWVKSARGWLLHLAKLKDGLICDYCILAPTEWNFHSDASLPLILKGLEVRSDEEAQWLTKIAILTLDPCIDFTVGVTHA